MVAEAQVPAEGAVLRLHHAPPDNDHDRLSLITKAATSPASPGAHRPAASPPQEFTTLAPSRKTAQARRLLLERRRRTVLFARQFNLVCPRCGMADELIPITKATKEATP